MRRFDKTKNIQTANLLAEQRYLESLNEISTPYYKSLPQTLDAVREYATELGYEASEDDIWTYFGTGGIPYETDKSADIRLLKNGKPILDKREKEMNRFIHVSIYRMPSGRYELNMYKTF